MLGPLERFAVKVSEFYDKMFKSWTNFIIIFVIYFILMAKLPDKIANPIMYLFLAFIVIAFVGRGIRRKNQPPRTK